MEIIGEKINGTRKKVAQAIAQRNGDIIRDLALRQAEAGADWLDLNAGTHPRQELEDLTWLIEQAQAASDKPLCLDSANPEALAGAVQVVDKRPMINSISGEQKRLEGILPIVAEHGCKVIALAMDSKSIPKESGARVAIVDRVIEATRAAGVPDDDVYVDPLVMTIATDTDSGAVVLDTIRTVRQKYPSVHLTVGLSNVSFGLPARPNINRAFLTLAREAGLDCAILDPLDNELRAAILATELLLGRDRHCLNYVRAARSGVFD
jgi:5-methyltetrahydrofolate--homocysteine methyltransferase